MNDKRFVANQSGSTILYVLFILFIITLLATTITTIMLRSNRTTLGLSHALHARYAAESGTERALYYLQYARTVKTVGVESAVVNLATLIDTFDTGASYSVVADVTDDTYAPEIKQNSSQQWDIFGESYPNGANQPPVLTPLADLSNISVAWNENSLCAVGNYVEISFSSWTQYEWESLADPATLPTRYILQCPSTDPSSPFDCNYQFGVDDTHLYKVRVKPLDCVLDQVMVTALDSVPAAIETQNLVTIDSTGEYSNSTRILNSVTTLWDPRLQQYFDFVVFSEQEITK